MIVVAQEADVDIEVLDEVGQHPSDTSTDVAAFTPISWVATEVTTKSRLLGKFISDI